MKDIARVHKFSLLSLHTQSLQIGEKMSEKWAKIFGQNCPHFLFTFFFLPQPSRKCGLPFFSFFFSFYFFWI